MKKLTTKLEQLKKQSDIVKKAIEFFYWLGAVGGVGYVLTLLLTVIINI